MRIKKLLGVCAAALVVAAPAFAGDAPAAGGTYFAGQDCVGESGVPRELPFAEGQTPPKPCKGNFWTLITKPAVFDCQTEEVKVGDATFYMKPVPPVYEWVDEQIMVAPERKIPYCQPAKFNRKCVEVVVQEASTQYEIIPAEFETINEEITFRPEMEKEIFIPAQYCTVMKTIEIEPERDILCGVATPTDVKLNCGETVGGSIGALHKPARCITIAVMEEVSPASTKKVKVPAIVKTVPVRKLKKPAEVREVQVPAVVSKIWVETCVGEECIKFRDIPAEFKQIRRMVMKEEGKTERVEVPAKFETIKKNVLVTPTQMIWRQYSISKCKAVADVTAKYGSLPGSGAF